jgi:hypothetical protein
VVKGLAWLVKQQHADGHWQGNAGEHATALTALAGLALLSEGSTLREGKYRGNLARAADWLLDNAQPNGLLATRKEGRGRYIHGHGYAMLFLASAAGDLEGRPRARVLLALERAARFARSAQTRRGGWGYVAAKDGAGFDEESPTAAVVHGLRAARRAGVRLPPGVLEEGQKYLEMATAPSGELRYPPPAGSRPGLKAAVLAAVCAPGDYGAPAARAWLAACRERVPPTDEYAQFYLAQVAYGLGDGGWSAYRKTVFPELCRTQARDGSWTNGTWGRQVGPVLTTAMNLCVLQMENEGVAAFVPARR